MHRKHYTNINVIDNGIQVTVNIQNNMRHHWSMNCSGVFALFYFSLYECMYDIPIVCGIVRETKMSR